jgi:Ca2+-binding RTX toxin-like protein
MDNMNGGDDADSMFGENGNDELMGGHGNDRMEGGDGEDVLRGNGGADDMHGDGGDDRIKGNGGDDVMEGGAGNDLLMGGGGNDSMAGGDGDDTLMGGGGDDTLMGGAGDDVFSFTGTPGASESATIADFSSGEDLISLDLQAFTAMSMAGPLSADEFKAVAGGVADEADDRIIYDTDTGVLYYDADGNGSGDAIQFATMTGAPALTEADFIASG